MKYITRNYHSSLRKRIVMLLVSTLPAAAFAQGIVGSWKGVLDVGGAKLNLVFHIKGDKSVTMDSPDQGAMGIPTTVKCFAADSLCVEMEAMNVVYSGKLVGDEIKGTFSQMGYFPSESEERGSEDQPTADSTAAIPIPNKRGVV